MGERITIKLSELGNIVGGATPSTLIDRYWDGDIPWITPKDLSIQNSRFISRGERSITREGLESCSAMLMPKYTVLFSSRAPIGYISISENEVCTNQGFKSIVADKTKANYMFLYYLLNYKKSEIEGLGSGTTFKEVSGAVLKNFYVEVPKDIMEQKAIADVLSALDDKIELNNRINKNLEKQAQAIFARWFVDFDFPDESGNPYKSSGGEMIDSELGEIPKGWKIEKLGDISEIQNGFAFKSADYIDNGISMIRTSDFTDEGFISTDNLINLPINFYNDERFVNFVLKKFDILLVMVGASVGKIVMVTSKNLPSLQNQNMWRFRKKRKEVSQFFIKNHVCKCNYNVRQSASGSARDFYRKDLFNNYPLAFPAEEILNTYDKININLYNKIDINLKQNQKLVELRDYLLPKLMSGEIKVNC